MILKEIGYITIDLTKKKKVECHKFLSEILNRELMLHPDFTNKQNTTLSDFETGYRLFSIPKNTSEITLEEVNQELGNYINHYTIEGIEEEIKRIQKLADKESK